MIPTTQAGTFKIPAPARIPIAHPGRTVLDDENKIWVIEDVLNPEELAAYVEAANSVERFSGQSVFGHVKPREEVCYSPDGAPYTYSRIKHETRVYPEHVLALVEKAREVFGHRLGEISSGVDIVYSDKFERGGSIGAHSDDEMHWPRVLIFSVGQLRWLRIKQKDGEKKFVASVPLAHNSFVLMNGPTFQQMYTHQVDKLPERVPVSVRHSLNVRFT